MSYVAIATANFDAMAHFYGEVLAFPTLRAWDRPRARGRRLDLGGLTLELLDAAREAQTLDLPGVGDRLHLVIEVPDVGVVSQTLGGLAAPPESHSWGARSLRIIDPDGIPVVFLQWLDPGIEPGS